MCEGIMMESKCGSAKFFKLCSSPPNGFKSLVCYNFVRLVNFGLFAPGVLMVIGGLLRCVSEVDGAKTSQSEQSYSCSCWPKSRLSAL